MPSTDSVDKRGPEQSRGEASPRVLIPALAVLLVGLMVTSLVAWRVEVAATADDLADLEDRGDELGHAVTDAIDTATERLVAVGAFYQGSQNVTQAEFSTFISNFEEIPGMGGLGYMRLVSRADLSDYEERMEAEVPGFLAWELDSEGNRIPVAPRNVYALLESFEPAEAFDFPQGFDSYSEPNRRSALTRAQLGGEATATPLLQLLARADHDGFLLYWPVRAADTGHVVGFTLAPMDLGDLIAGQADQALVGELDWRIESIIPGRAPAAAEEGAWNTVIEVGGHQWLLTVSLVADATPGFHAAPALVIAVGFLVSGFIATAVYLYRRKIEAQRELARLQDLARAKDQFLASVSHELRTPLTSVLGFAQLLRDSKTELSEAERATMIANVASEAADLSSIIDDLLVSARSELNSLALTRVPVSLRAQVAQVLETVEGSSGQSCVFAGTGKGLVAEGDPGRVRQIIRNLITNAGRYGGDNVEIRFGSDEETRAVYLEVADDGPGVADDEWERIFEPYHRAHDSVTQPAAIGIGLSVARQLARLMEGDLAYRRENGWSVFRLTLPAVESHPVPDPAVAATSTV